MILFLVAAVAAAVRANSGTPCGRKDLISPTRPHHFRKGPFLSPL